MNAPTHRTTNHHRSQARSGTGRRSTAGRPSTGTRAAAIEKQLADSLASSVRTCPVELAPARDQYGKLIAPPGVHVAVALVAHTRLLSKPHLQRLGAALTVIVADEPAMCQDCAGDLARYVLRSSAINGDTELCARCFDALGITTLGWTSGAAYRVDPLMISVEATAALSAAATELGRRSALGWLRGETLPPDLRGLLGARRVRQTHSRSAVGDWHTSRVYRNRNRRESTLAGYRRHSIPARSRPRVDDPPLGE